MHNQRYRFPLRTPFPWVLLQAIVLSFRLTCGYAASAANGEVLDCNALESADFAEVLDAPTQVTSAAPVQAVADMPAYCLAKGYVSPNVGIEMGLPLRWNGKFIELGCGGHCGVLPDDGEFPIWCGDELRKGYACIVSDMGHQGNMDDALWGYNNLPAKMDWGYRATHVVALAGKAVIEFYYHRPPSKSYFTGGSTGGRQGLQEAQRFPWDFDGIVAIAPPVDLSTIYMTFAWGIRTLHDQDGKPLLGKEELKLLTDAVVAKCDMDDGVKDGVIGDPLHCAFDPAELTCNVKKKSGCLTSIQVEAVKKVYSGPLNSKGEKLSLGGPVVGSELGQWDRDPRCGWGYSYLGFGDKYSGYKSLATDGFRYLFFWPDPGPMWKLSNFDFDRDSHRMATMQALYDSSNPDLRRFKAAGGKLLVFQGLNDNSVLPRKTIDYYETVERTMGGQKATESFFRLFVLPGVGHGGGGPGADTVDYLSALEVWVEEDRAPDRLIAAHLKDIDLAHPPFFPLDPARVQFTRPVYPFPVRAKYSGRGNPDDAANFGPAQP
jgi:hypothetical protein